MNYIKIISLLIIFVFLFYLSFKLNRRRIEKTIIVENQSISYIMIKRIFDKKSQYMGNMIYIEDLKNDKNYLCLVFDDNEVILSININHLKDFSWESSIIERGNKILSEKSDYIQIEIKEEETIIEWIDYICKNKLGMSLVSIFY